MTVFYKILWVFKTCIYTFLMSILSFFDVAIAVNDLPFYNLYAHLVLKKSTLNPFTQTDHVTNEILLLDYMDLIRSSDKMKAYDRTAAEFSQYFEEGLLKSLAFYQASTIRQSEINDLIKVNLYSNVSLNHPIERPQAIKTSLPLALNSLSQFSGEWHGHWEKMRVHHLWLPVRKLVQSITDEVTLMGFQSCFTGDGFGWNYIVKQGDQIVILGFVVHLNEEGTVTNKNPHYAFLNHSNRLIWIAEHHVYYEFICDNSTCPDTKHYVITGADRKSTRLNSSHQIISYAVFCLKKKKKKKNT